MAEELKPCPMCGGKARTQHLDCMDNYEYWYVECDECGVKTGRELSEKCAIEAWNTRAESPELRAIKRATVRIKENYFKNVKEDLTDLGIILDELAKEGVTL